MKTPLSVLFLTVFYWIVLYGATMVTQFSTNYNFNLIWMTLVLPNLLRLVVGNIPRLAVDRVFFLSTTVIALLITYIFNRFVKSTKDGIEEPSSDKSKKLKSSFLLMGAFAAGAFITYGIGIDTSIYSNMGWETQGLTM
jgi:hypothetical protein|tara:strand:+ start:7934 stop:8350 length:417 start_codon:yes stop_codon:yes gene_type:complete